jgi:ABC-2 type transport system permease protein
VITAELRSGPGYWFGSLRSMMRFDFGRMRTFAPMMVVIQTMMGAGMALLYGFLYPHITADRALYIATGAPTLALVPLGFAMLPGSIGTEKDEGSFEYVWTLPAPRSAQATSIFLLYTLLAMPGTALALLVATLRYGVELSPSLLLVPAALLCALMSIAVGYGMALAIPDPLVTNLVVNGLMFVVLLFSPIVYPASQLPGWLFEVHRFLPFYNMAAVVRAGLTRGLVADVGTSFLVLGAWTVAGWCATAWVVRRRP